MHVFSFDGPGQGESNLRGIGLTASNYEEAARAALDQLLARPEIDPQRIGLYGLSVGSHWAARERRIRALAAPSASFVDKYYLMTQESSRYRQLFADLTQSRTEEELDLVMRAISVEVRIGEIGCPALFVTGKYDPRAPLEQVLRLFERVRAPAELWLLADQHHDGSLTGGPRAAVWDADIHSFVCDWLRERFEGRPLRHPGKVLYLEPGGAGPNSAAVSRRRRWFD